MFATTSPITQFIEVSSKVDAAGARLARDERVVWQCVDRPVWRLDVEGDDGECHEVSFDHTLERTDGLIVYDCSCNGSREGKVCNHLAAALHFAVDRLDEWAEDSILLAYDDLMAPERRKLERAAKKAKALKPGKTPAKPQVVTPEWERSLNTIRTVESQLTRIVAPIVPQYQQRTTENWFVLDLVASATHSRPIVRTNFRQITKAGSWGKMKSLSVRPYEVDRLPAEDRAILKLLHSRSTTYGYSYYGGRNDTYEIQPEMMEFALPKLCETGRFGWVAGTQDVADENQRLSWDEGPAWSLRLSLVDCPERNLWQLRGEFFRDGEVMPVALPGCILHFGLMIVDNRLARLSTAGLAWIQELRRKQALDIPYEHRDSFIKLYYSLSAPPSVQFPENFLISEVTLPPEPHLRIRPPVKFENPRSLFASVVFRYGDADFSQDDKSNVRPEPEKSRILRRDPAAETRWLRMLTTAGLALTSSSRTGKLEEHYEFPAGRLPQLVDVLSPHGWVIESDGRRVRQLGRIDFDVRSTVDWFELNGQVDFGGAKATFPSLLAALRRDEKFVRLDDGTHGLIPEDWMKKYATLASLGEVDGDTLKFVPSQAMLLDALLAAQDNVRVDEQFLHFRERLKSFEGIAPRPEPAGFQGELRGYQKEGLGWLHFLQDFRFGGCLADDMGLGKTVQVLSLLQNRRNLPRAEGESSPPSLVVVPKSLVFNWMDEAARFAPQLRVRNYTGLERFAQLERLEECDLLVTTYGTLRRDIVSLAEKEFDYVILDEAQAIKNHDSQSAKSCRLLKSRHRLAMTGTPVENHLGELWSLFEFLNPGMLGRSTAFSCLSRSGANRDEDSLVLLAQGLRPFMLRRTKEQVLKELPDKTEQTLYCELSGPERKKYDELRDYYRTLLTKRVQADGLARSKIHVLEALLRLRQAACHPGLLDGKLAGEASAKTETLLEQLAEVVDGGHKVLVFSQFTSLLSIVRKQLDEREIVYEYLDGRTRNREEKVKRFQSDPQCPVFLISLKAGGHGLNLTAAEYVFILDPWWNPAVEAQAIDRAHRIGQERPVFAYRIIARNTVEDKILEMQKSKRALADAIVSADDSLIRTLTAEDLQLLLE